MIYGNDTTNWEIWQSSNSLKHILPTHIIFAVRYKLSKMASMCGLWLLANQDISRYQRNSKRNANNRCCLT